jgi:hypothetical protein
MIQLFRRRGHRGQILQQVERQGRVLRNQIAEGIAREADKVRAADRCAVASRG